MAEWLPIADFAVKALTAAATVTLGYFAWKIATRQAQTASDKLKLDLFDRRYAVYLAVSAWIEDLQGRVVPDEDYAAHIRKVEPVRFLFGGEVNEWITGLRKSARDMNYARKVLQDSRESHRDDRRHEEIVEANKTYSKLTMDFDRELERSAMLFAPYLDFGKAL